MVAIKDFEMPAGCNVCPFRKEDNKGQSICGMMESIADRGYIPPAALRKGIRLEDCPLVESDNPTENPKSFRDKWQSLSAEQKNELLSLAFEHAKYGI